MRVTLPRPLSMVLRRPERPSGKSSRYCHAVAGPPDTSIQTTSVVPEPFMSAHSIDPPIAIEVNQTIRRGNVEWRHTASQTRWLEAPSAATEVIDERARP